MSGTMVRVGGLSLFAVAVVAAGVLAAPRAFAIGHQPHAAESAGALSPDPAAAGPLPPSLSGAAPPSAGPAFRPGGAGTLNVVAHEDDDLLFINPAVGDDIAAGRCVVTVFVTAGDAGRRTSYWRGREAGAMAAYSAMAETADQWTTDTIVAGRHRITRSVLAGTRITLLFLRLPDGHGNDARPGETLQNLWRGQTGTIRPLDSAAGGYTRAELIGTLTALMNHFQPDDIRTLDYAGTYGDGDHTDHHTVGYLTDEAQRAYRSPHRFTGYLGYPAERQPANLPIPVRDQKLAWFLAYAPFDPKVCQTAADCLTNFYEPRFARSVPVESEIVGAL